MSRSFRLTRLTSAVLLAAGLAGAAHATTITREFSSVWFDPAKSGHGLGLEVIEGAGGKELLAYWFTYDAQGRQMWVFGTAPIAGDTVRMTAYVTSGGRFDGAFSPSSVRSSAWGTLEFSFADCDTGTLRYTPNDPAAPHGTMPLTRLTRLFNSTCTGGISDDRNTAATATRSAEFLVNRGAYPAASARVRFEDRSDRSEFSVELEDLPAGSYTLRVDDVVRGSITVAPIARGTEGELEFRSPVEPGKVLLDFDPRGAIVEILEGNRVLFDSVFDGGTDTGGGNTPPPGGAPGNGNARYELVLEPSGNDGPELDAKLELRQDRVDFSVELEDVAVGTYRLQVGGVQRGSIDVVSVPGGTEGEIEYRNPVEPGKFVLDFDPRGAQIVVTFNGTSVFSGTFPTAPNGAPSGNDDGSGDDNGGGDDDGPGDDNGGDDDGPGDDNGGDDDGPGDDNGGGDDDGPGDDNGGDDDGPGDDNGGGDDDGPGDDNGGDDDDDDDDHGGDDDDDDDDDDDHGGDDDDDDHDHGG
ncbi:hypothetical protein [Chiayiivirga flava]|uniref:Uncharacterized protein n=1 Tax=Chiayiivirga flava TaxID=659595 RepID=A0A7W8D610_9GAMM|nr:hypothetical protein [Chiayiivirga flava]MBB5206898.1 hypothetical protein [Chiayiivirga flava]